MSPRVVTAEQVLRSVQDGATELVLAPGERLTPLAHDIAGERGLRVRTAAAATPLAHTGHATGSSPSSGRPLPPLRHVPGVDRIALDAFPVDLDRPAMDVRSRDVVGGAEGLPMAAGVLSLREGSFPWTLDYDEVQYVLEGELHITRGTERVVGRPGDLIAVPRGSAITFGTPSWAKFLYVTYPADWGGS